MGRGGIIYDISFFFSEVRHRLLLIPIQHKGELNMERINLHENEMCKLLSEIIGVMPLRELKYDTPYEHTVCAVFSTDSDKHNFIVSLIGNPNPEQRERINIEVFDSKDSENVRCATLNISDVLCHFRDEQTRNSIQDRLINYRKIGAFSKRLMDDIGSVLEKISRDIGREDNKITMRRLYNGLGADEEQYGIAFTRSYCYGEEGNVHIVNCSIVIGTTRNEEEIKITLNTKPNKNMLPEILEGDFEENLRKKAIDTIKDIIKTDKLIKIEYYHKPICEDDDRYEPSLICTEYREHTTLIREFTPDRVMLSLHPKSGEGVEVSIPIDEYNKFEFGESDTAETVESTND